MRDLWVAVVAVFAASSGLVGFKMLREIADFDQRWTDRQAVVADLADPPGSTPPGSAVPERGEAC